MTWDFDTHRQRAAERELASQTVGIGPRRYFVDIDQNRIHLALVSKTANCWIGNFGPNLDCSKCGFCSHLCEGNNKSNCTRPESSRC